MRVRNVLASLVVLPALLGAAWGQYGLYGAPDTLPVPAQANYNNSHFNANPNPNAYQGYQANPPAGPVMPAAPAAPTWTPPNGAYNYPAPTGQFPAHQHPAYQNQAYQNPANQNPAYQGSANQIASYQTPGPSAQSYSAQGYSTPNPSTSSNPAQNYAFQNYPAAPAAQPYSYVAPTGSVGRPGPMAPSSPPMRPVPPMQPQPTFSQPGPAQPNYGQPNPGQPTFEQPIPRQPTPAPRAYGEQPTYAPPSLAPTELRPQPYMEPQPTPEPQPRQPLEPNIEPIPAPEQGYPSYPAYPGNEQPTVEPTPRANVVNQLINESGQSSCGGFGYQDCNQSGCATDCGPICQPTPCYPWYAMAQWLFLGRDKPNRLYTSYEMNNEPHQLYEFSMDWKSGGEVRLGRRLGCGGCWAIEATYWTLDPMSDFARFTIPGGEVGTPMDVARVHFGADNGVDLFDNSPEHRVWRRSEFHNVEVNLLRRDLGQGAVANWNVEWSLGARFFRFEDNFLFGSVRNGHTWEDADVHKAYLRDDIQNNLVGFQFGFDARSNPWHCLSLFVSPQFGIYNNHIDNKFQLYRGDGVIGQPTVASGWPGTFPVATSANVVSFLTEIDLGMRWQITPRWSVHGGYRVVVASGVGLADAQVPQYYIADIAEIARIDYNGDLILHGAFAGLELNF